MTGISIWSTPNSASASTIALATTTKEGVVPPKLQGRVQQRSFEVLEEMRGKWKAAGGEIVQLPADDQAKLAELLKPVGPDVTKSSPALDAFYKRVRSVGDKY